MDPSPSPTAQAFVEKQRQLRAARRARAYGFLRINTAAIRAAFGNVESPRLTLSPKPSSR